MPLLMLALLVGVLLYMWVARRGSTLTRACRWRLERGVGAGAWRCAACGAEMVLPTGKEPRDCLRGRG